MAAARVLAEAAASQPQSFWLVGAIMESQALVGQPDDAYAHRHQPEEEAIAHSLRAAFYPRVSIPDDLAATMLPLYAID